MADGTSIERRARQALAAQGVGLRSEQPTVTLANQRTRGAQGDIYAMPSDGGGWYALQVTDTASGNFGAFWFLPDYDTPGDPSKPVR